MAPESITKRTLVLLGIVIGAVLVLYLFFYAWGHRATISRLFQGSEHKVSLPGKIYLSLAPENGAAPSGIYTYTLATGILERVLVDINVALPTYEINTSPTLSDDGTLLAFIRRKNSEPVQQVYTALPDGTGSRQVTTSPEKYKREPILSPTKDMVAFSASSGVQGGAETEGLPDDWGIYLADISGNTLRVATGTNPLFSPDGKELLVLMNDGVHLFDIHDQKKISDKGIVLRPTGSDSYAWMRASLSHDGTRIAWTVPSTRKVFVAKITSWNPFSTILEKTISTLVYQAIFSLDDGKLALEEIRPSQTRLGDTHIVISIYDLTNGRLSDAIDLYKYNNAYIRLGGWAE